MTLYSCSRASYVGPFVAINVKKRRRKMLAVEMNNLIVDGERRLTRRSPTAYSGPYKYFQSLKSMEIKESML